MADEKKEPWLNLLALTTVIFAVCATLSTFKGGGYSTRSVLSQSMASDQWAFFQAKSIKQYMYEMQHEQLELSLKQLGPKGDPAMLAEYQRLIKVADGKIKKYETEKGEISAAAKKLEETKIHSQEHSQSFGMAVIFLQIAILLSSIAALMKRKGVYVLGLLTGVAGALIFVNGWLLIVKL
jgi:hypothetical protein